MSRSKKSATAKALHAAVAAIYFDDSSDFLCALWDVVRALDPTVAELLESDPKRAYGDTKAASDLKETPPHG